MLVCLKKKATVDDKREITLLVGEYDLLTLKVVLVSSIKEAALPFLEKQDSSVEREIE
jgi:hypothetical protein